METFAISGTRPLAWPVHVIKNRMVPDAVWQLGEVPAISSAIGPIPPNDRPARLYFVAFAGAYRHEAVTHIGNETADRRQTHPAATILAYQTSRLSRIKGNHCNFLCEVLANGRLVYKREGFGIPRFARIPADVAAKVAYWEYCLRNARASLEAGRRAHNGNVVTAMLLRQAVEMAALGLVYMFMDCRPGPVGVTGLLRLCALFMPETEAVLDDDVSGAVWAVTQDTMRYRSTGPDEGALARARAGAHRFLAAAQAYAEEGMKNGIARFEIARLPHLNKVSV
jgi:hypothetical protein